MSELKPCPFCGNKTPTVVHHFVNGIANLSHCFIRCNCGRGKTTASRKEEQEAMNEWNTRPIEDELRAEIARLNEIIARLKEDGERLASTYVVEVFPHEWVCRGGCHHWARFGEQIDHAPDCPITLHRALMKELE